MLHENFIIRNSYNQETFFKLDKGEIIKSNDVRELVNNDTKNQSNYYSNI